MSSFILGDYLAEVHMRAAQQEEPYPQNATVFADQLPLLKKYGARSLSYFVFFHCKYAITCSSLRDEFNVAARVVLLLRGHMESYNAAFDVRHTAGAGSSADSSCMSFRIRGSAYACLHHAK